MQVTNGGRVVVNHQNVTTRTHGSIQHFRTITKQNVPHRNGMPKSGHRGHHSLSRIQYQETAQKRNTTNTVISYMMPRPHDHQLERLQTMPTLVPKEKPPGKIWTTSKYMEREKLKKDTNEHRTIQQHAKTGAQRNMTSVAKTRPTP